ncbi:hypothetical protein ACRQ4C_07360 [Curtobacterium sp. SP.BCp]|uniref:rhamnosyltransferase WsaF family glycosyltransferase n=1 Tax=Curtobacterium sp. SP.BCp TaxID=3435230 RepID=UPI003F73B513
MPAAARPYHELVETSLALSPITLDDSRSVNVVIGEIRAGGAFAGIQTAVTVGFALARRLGLPMRIVMVGWTSSGNSAAAAAEVVRSRFPDEEAPQVLAREDLVGATFGSDDVWLATHWKTAHAVDVAATAGKIRRENVTYLVQDYEPGFSPWSTEFAIARSTYHAGFTFIVNSSPLRDFLAREEGVHVPDDRVFAPHLDLDLLRSVAARRDRSEATRVFFYGRPSKHRNLFRLGVAALKVAAAELDPSVQVEFVSAGEKHKTVGLGNDRSLTSLGTLPWDEYFDFVSGANVVLSLQYSPHPSHPPLDGAISGARVVTNEFYGTRGGMHPRIVPANAEPRALGLAIAQAVREAAASGPAPFEDIPAGRLGGPIDTAIDNLVIALAEAAR